MKWIKENKRLRRQKWHKWYAWHPVTLSEKTEDGNYKKCWFEYVERMIYYGYVYDDACYYYRKLSDK